MGSHKQRHVRPGMFSRDGGGVLVFENASPTRAYEATAILPVLHAADYFPSSTARACDRIECKFANQGRRLEVMIFRNGRVSANSYISCLLLN